MRKINNLMKGDMEHFERTAKTIETAMIAIGEDTMIRYIMGILMMAMKENHSDEEIDDIRSRIIEIMYSQENPMSEKMDYLREEVGDEIKAIDILLYEWTHIFE